MTNADITVREYMEQEATQELRNGNRQGSLLVAMDGVAPAKGDLVLLERDQAVVGNGCDGCSCRDTSGHVRGQVAVA